MEIEGIDMECAPISLNVRSGGARGIVGDGRLWYYEFGGS